MSMLFSSKGTSPKQTSATAAPAPWPSAPYRASPGAGGSPPGAGSPEDLSDNQIQRIVERVNALWDERTNSKMDRLLEEMIGNLKSFVLSEVTSMGGQRIQDATDKEKKEMMAAMTAMHVDMEVVKGHSVKVAKDQEMLNQAVQLQAKTLQERNTKLEQETDRMLHDHASMLATLTTQGNDLQRQIDDLAKSVEKQSRTLDDFGWQSGGLDKRITELEKQLKKRMEDFQSTVDHLHSQKMDNPEHQRRFAELDQALKERKAHADNLHKKVQDQDAKLTAHGRNLAQVEGQHGAFSNQLAEMDKRHGERHDDFGRKLHDSVRQRHEDHQDKLANHDKDLAQLRSQHAEHAKQQDELNKALQHLKYRDQESAKDLDDKLAEHHAKLTALDKDHSTLRNQHAEMDKRFGRHVDEVGRTLNDHSDTLADHNKRHGEHGGRHGDLIEQHAGMGKDFERLWARHDELLRMLQDYGGKLEDCDRNVTQLDAQNRDLAKQQDELEKALGEQQLDKVHELLKDLSNLEGQVEHLRRALDEESASRGHSIGEVISQVERQAQDNADFIAENRTRIDDVAKEQSGQTKEMVEMDKVLHELREKFQHMSETLPPKIAQEARTRTSEFQQLQADLEAMMMQLRGLIGHEEQSRMKNLIEKDSKLRELAQQIGEYADRCDELKRAVVSERQDRNGQAEDIRTEFRRLVAKEEQDRIEENTTQRTEVLKALRKLHEGTGARLGGLED